MGGRGRVAGSQFDGNDREIAGERFGWSNGRLRYGSVVLRGISGQQKRVRKKSQEVEQERSGVAGVAVQ